MLSLTPQALEELQPHEVYAMIDAFRYRERWQDRKWAYYITILLSAQGGKEFSFKDVYEGIYQGLHPQRISTKQEETTDFLTQFNFKGK